MKKTITTIFTLLFPVILLSAKTITVTSSADSGAGTLREAVNNADANDVIVFANDITTIYFSGVIKLNKNITISGNETNNIIFQNGSTWTDTANKKRYFEILANAMVTLNYLTLKDNVSNCGGGAISNKGKLTLSNCTFSNNRAYDIGGAIYSSSNASLIIDNCNFNDNYAPRTGGAIDNYGEFLIKNSNFNNNRGNDGGAVSIFTSNANIANNITNCVFENNLAQYGSAIVNSSNLNIDKCIFTKNNSTAALGTIVNSCIPMNAYSYILQGNLTGTGKSECNLFVSNSLFYENQSNSREIFTNCFDANVTIINCLFAENITQNPLNNNKHKYYPDWQNHGIISNLNIVGYKYNIGIGSNAKLTIINSTIANNQITGLYTNGEVNLYNSIIWNDEAGEENDVFLNETAGILTASNNLIGEDPLFLGNGDYSLQENSSAIDAGNNSLISSEITKDLADNRRISNGIVDLGAYMSFKMVMILHL